MTQPIPTLSTARRRVLGMLVALGLPVPWSVRADKIKRLSGKEAMYYTKR